MVSSGLQAYDTTTGAITGRTLTPGAGINITNGSGVAGNPTAAAQASTVSGASNIGITYAAGTFTVCSASGAALSATNPGYITLQSKGSPGLLTTISVTANQTFVDDAGASTIVGNSFQTASVLWADDMPVYLYAVSNDAENAIAFAISRIPHRTTAPAAATFAKVGSAVATTQGSFFALGNPTITDYDANPCLLIGAFRMTKTTAAHDWTVTALNNSDGIGKFHEGTVFTYPWETSGCDTLANGNDSYFLDNGGTAPTHANGGFVYKLSKYGTVDIVFGTTILASGLGAVGACISLPYHSFSAENHGSCVIGTLLNQSIDAGSQLQHYFVNVAERGDTTHSYISFFLTHATTTSLLNTDLVLNNIVRMSCNYFAVTT